MPFIQRDENGAIVGLFHEPQPNLNREYLPDDDPDVQAFYIVRPSLHDRLKAILLTLPVEVQASFGQVAAAINLAIENGSPDVAKVELNALPLPSELEPIRTAMLKEINRG